MTRILTYNIEFGGTGRVDQIVQVIGSARPDVVGLLEATNPCVIEQLAAGLGLEYRLTGRAQAPDDWQIAVLSRLPITNTLVYLIPGVLSKPLLEIGVQEEGGGELMLFVAHLASSFARGMRGGDRLKRAEVREVLRIAASKRGTPHLIMGDFNSLAPGDSIKGSSLLSYVAYIDQLYRANSCESLGHIDLDFVVPRSLRFLNPLLRQVPGNALLSAFFDMLASLYVARGSVRLLCRAGYVDSFRRLNPFSQGFTCPAKAPAGRIDYIFASPELAWRLCSSYVVEGTKDVRGEQASDHLPVLVEFGVPRAVY